MKHEKSCGAVIFHREGSETLFLIEKMAGGHLSMCKGHVEEGETEHETALREIAEETALSVKFVPGFRETISYSPYPGCVKEVVFFLAEARSSAVKPQESEVAEIYWLPLSAALDALTHESDKKVLSAAGSFLAGR